MRDAGCGGVGAGWRRVRHNGVGMASTTEPTFDALWPRSPRGIQPQRLADRLDGLDGARVAFLWDRVFRGDEVLPALAAELRDRIPGLEIVGYDEFGNTHGGDEDEVIAGLPGALARRHIDAVVSAMGC